MGIYINGIEMPKSCSECPLMEYNEETGCYCYLTNQYASRTRPDGCPLIPIPLHGRLGDLDELLDRAFGCLDEETFIAFQFLVNGSVTIIPAEEGE